MIGAVVNAGKLAYVSKSFHNSLLAIYNILSLSPLDNRTYYSGH